jgi:putative aldouronate transport system substrate-binding protein
MRGAFPGEMPSGYDAVLAALNEKLSADLSTQLEVSWIASDGYAESVAASGQSLDFFACDSSDLAGFADKGLVAPLDEWMADYGANIYKNIAANLIDTMKVGGKLMGVPGAGNTPLSGTGLAFIYREDLRLKYGLPEIATVGDMENYLDAVKKNEPGLAPLSSTDAVLALMPALGPEAMLAGTGDAVAVSFGSGNSSACSCVQDAASFKAAAKKARDWYRAGWQPKGVVAAEDPQGAVASGKAASTFGSVRSLYAMQTALAKTSQDAALSCAPVAGASTRYVEGDGGSALCLTAGCKHPDRVVEFWDWVYADQANYDLVCYGLENKNYVLAGDGILLGASGAMPLEAVFSNANFMRFAPGAPDSAMKAFRHWNDGAVLSPLAGFAFDGSGVQEKLDQVGEVYATYGKLLFSGSSDVDTMLAEFGAKLKDAGQDDIVAEAQKQVDAFLKPK